MPRPPLIDTLPDNVRDELNARLVNQGFGGYEALSAWLGEQGYQIGTKAVWTHGSKLKEKMEKSMGRARERMEIAKALRGASDDEKAALMEANEMIAMDKVMDLFDEWDGLEQVQRAKQLPTIVRAIADLNRSATGTAKWKAQFESKLSTLEAEATGAAPTTRKLDAETLRIVRQEVYGLV